MSVLKVKKNNENANLKYTGTSLGGLESWTDIASFTSKILVKWKKLVGENK